jgi:hypothetical protein
MFVLAHLSKIGDHSRRPVFLVPRNSHKAVFSALKLIGADALLIPVEIDNEFQTALSPSLNVLEAFIRHNCSDYQVSLV